MADKDQDKVNPIQVQKFLGGIDYPCSKQDLMKLLDKLPDRDYDAPTDVTKAIGKLSNSPKVF